MWKMELFSVTAVARGLVVGLSNKLADVVEHVVPIKQYKKSFGKLRLDRPEQ